MLWGRRWPGKVVLLAVLALLAVSCVPMGSRLYQPISPSEQEAFANADRNIYPDDVRKDPSAHTSSGVAWAGLVRSARVDEQAEKLTITFDIEHHYYDWIEDFSPMNPPIWLSPRGEGRFRASWDFKRDTGKDVIEEMTESGYLVIVYGVPTRLDGDTILVEASHIRGISQRFYTTGLSDYGRADEK